MGLETVYERSGEHARDQRVLGEVLEVAPAQRGALDVDPGAEHDVDPLRPSLDGDRLAHPAHELGVEGRRKRRCGGEARGRRAARDPVVLAILRLPTQPMRAIGHGDRRDAQSRHRSRVPEVGAQAQRCLLLQRQLGQQWCVPQANVCEPVTPVNCTAPSRSTAVTPAAGAPSARRPCQSIVIVRGAAELRDATVPDVPFGAAIVKVNDESRCPRRQRETSAPDGVGIWPCAHSTLPGLRRDDPRLVARGHRARAEQVAAQARDGPGRPTVREARVGVDVGAVLVELLPQRSPCSTARSRRSSDPTGCGSAPARPSVSPAAKRASTSMPVTNGLMTVE